MKTIKPLLESLVSDVKTACDAPDKGPKVRAQNPIALWLPPDYKQRWDEIQERSDKQLSKSSIKIICAMIDEVDKEGV
jgi:hypothetical protein